MADETPILPDPDEPFTWHPGKAAVNLAKHGVSFEVVYDFDFSAALIREDRRQNYGEQRFQAISWIGPAVYVLIYSDEGEKTVVISLRQADRLEKKFYVQQTAGR